MDRKSEEECPKTEAEEDTEEALSLCDLPLNLMIDKENEVRVEEDDNDNDHDDDDDQEFNFDSSRRSLSGSVSSEMCAADHVFFKGQILPLSGLSSEKNNDFALGNGTIRCTSRSESMDRGSSSAVSFNSSSRSSSSSSSSRNPYSIPRNSKPTRLINQFHTYPSPKPQIRVSRNASVSRSQRSTMWDFMKLGLVRGPEFELGSIPQGRRNSFSRNSSTGTRNEKKKQRRGGSMLSGCKCSISEVVETVPLNQSTDSKTDDEIRRLENRLLDLKLKKTMKKQAMSRHRTFEWLKELSDASFVADDNQS